MIAIGATRYTDYSHSNVLKRDDISMVVVYDGSKYTPEDLMKMAEKGEFERDGISSIVQQVVSQYLVKWFEFIAHLVYLPCHRRSR